MKGAICTLTAAPAVLKTKSRRQNTKLLAFASIVAIAGAAPAAADFWAPGYYYDEDGKLYVRECHNTCDGRARIVEGTNLAICSTKLTRHGWRAGIYVYNPDQRAHACWVPSAGFGSARGKFYRCLCVS